MNFDEVKRLREAGELPLEWVNCLFSDATQWRLTKGRRDREDLFGDRIPRGESFYKRAASGGWDADIELSERSFELFCRALFKDNAMADVLAERVLCMRQEREEEGMRELVRKISES